MFELIDDGTLDTVLECSRCGQILRFDSVSLLSDEDVEETYESDFNDADELRITRAIEDAEWSHECEERR